MDIVKTVGQSSLEITKNSRGYTYTIKVYDFENEDIKTRTNGLISYVENKIAELSKEA